MKKSTILIIFLFSAHCLTAFGQQLPSSFSVVKSGKGERSIIFIPGFASSGDVWNETKAVFEPYFTCYTLTMPGFAGVKPQGNATFQDWENEIYAFIKSNQIEKPIVIGHSMGGALALAIAADYPELLDKFVVVDGLPCLAALMNPSFKSDPDIDCSAMIQQLAAMSDEQFTQMQKAGIASMLSDPSKQELVLKWSMDSDRKTFASMYCDFSNTDLRDRLKWIQVPSLVLLQPTFKNMTSEIKEQYKNLNDMSLAFAGQGRHFMMYDDKTWYLEQLNNFVAKPSYK